MSSPTPYSDPSVTVSYRSVDARLYHQEGKQIEFASLERAGELVAQMPECARETLLAPIKQGLIDPQSVFYLIDDKSHGQVAICVEDFVQLASNCYANEDCHLEMLTSDEDDSVVPPRLLNAFMLMSDKLEVYSVIDDVRSSGYASSVGENSRSRAGTALSKGDLSSRPALPESRPPALSLSSLFSSIASDSCINQQSFNDFGPQETSAEFSSAASIRKPSAPDPKPWSTKTSLIMEDLTSSLSFDDRKRIQNSYDDSKAAVNQRGYEIPCEYQEFVERTSRGCKQ